MTKTRINTQLRPKLAYYVKSQIEEGIDQTPLLEARKRLQAESLRLLAAAFPAEDMAILARYGQTHRYSHFSFLMPQGETRRFDFSSELPCDLPDYGSNRFEQSIEADAGFIAAAFEAETVEQGLRLEANRQWKQAEVLVGCALYYEDLLDYLAIPAAERVSLAHRWQLPVVESLPVPLPETPADDEDDESSNERWGDWRDDYSEEDEQDEEESLAA